MRRPADDSAPLRYLSGAELEACLPTVPERIALARRALVALAAGDAELPAKIGVHPRPGALLHAMPAWLRSADLVGLKWVSAFPDNNALGLPAINGLIVLNEAQSGLPTWILDAARVTAIRTAAVSGLAIDLLAPSGTQRVALLGAGVQAASHLEVIAALLPGATVELYGRSIDRARALAEAANGDAGRELVRVVDTVAAAVAEAQVVVTVATLGAQTQRLTPADLRPGALVVAVDFATYVAPEVAGAASLFAVDDRPQFLHYRELGYFDGYPEPTKTLGELGQQPLPDGSPSRHSAGTRPMLVTHLGVGLADVVFADAIAAAASARGLGTYLRR